MRITDIKTHLPVGLLRLTTDSEVEGWCLGVSEEVARRIQTHYREVLIGADPFDREAIWQELVRLDRYAYVPHTVRGIVDVALWDLAGKLTQLPVYKLIGGFRDRLPVYRSGGNLEKVSEYVEDAVRSKVEGFFGYKDHCKRGPDTMAAVARASRDAVGADFCLMHDAVQQYTVPEAMRLGRTLGEQSYYWFEEPLRDYDLIGLKKLTDALDVPIAATEYLPGSIYSTSQIVGQSAVDIVRASVPWRGGITDMLKIARLAESFGMSCEITSTGIMNGFVHAHVIGAIKNCTFFEGWHLGSLGGEPVIENPLEIADGHVNVPQGPGLGVELNWGEVEKATEVVI